VIIARFPFTKNSFPTAKARLELLSRERKERRLYGQVPSQATIARLIWASLPEMSMKALGFIFPRQKER
jgi:hypothetical protein